MGTCIKIIFLFQELNHSISSTKEGRREDSTFLTNRSQSNDKISIMSRRTTTKDKRKYSLWKLSSPVIIVILVIGQHSAQASPSPQNDRQAVKVNKCCEKFEVIVEGKCTIAKELNTGKIRRCSKPEL